MPTANTNSYGIAANATYRCLIRSEQQKEYASDMLGRWIGPFSPITFLLKLMEITEEDLNKMPIEVEFDRPCGTNNTDSSEKFVYTAFAKAICKYGLSPNMPLFISTDTSDDVVNTPNTRLREIHRIPLTTSTKHRYERLSTDSTPAEATHLADSAPRSFDWFQASLMVEFKKHTSDDPFWTSDLILKPSCHPNRDLKNRVAFEKHSRAARGTQGQLVIYASEVFAHQQRTHLFQLLICGEDARFICWDHSGAIVSESFDYTKQPLLLAEFLWRHNHMSDEAKGLDSTVKLACKADESVFRKSIDTFRKTERRKLPNIEDTFSGNYPVYEMSVEDDQCNMKLLVRRPVFKSGSAVGRATRGYVAVSQEDHAVLFLKDTWRVNHALLQVESAVYRLLEKYGVPHVPRVICGGDVKGSDGKAQTTRCVEWMNSQALPVGYATLPTHTHHRIVQRVAYPIESANNSKEYVTAFLNVVIVIERAYATEAKILHRDISFGNVMLADGVDGAVGLLGDWDHASVTNPGQNNEQGNHRVGTWAFMSVGMLRNSTKPHEILDDLESMYWTMLYGALHRFKHSGRMFDMSILTESRKATRSDGTSEVVGGRLKRAALSEMFELLDFNCKPLNRLLFRLARSLHRYYTAQQDLNQAEYAALDDDPEFKKLFLEVPAARKALQDQHEKVSKPSSWREEIATALARTDWIDDAVETSPYPIPKEDVETNCFREQQRTALSISEKLDDAARKNPQKQPLPPASLPRVRINRPALPLSKPSNAGSLPSISTSKRSRDEIEAGSASTDWNRQHKKLKPDHPVGPIFNGVTDRQPTGDEEEAETNDRVVCSKGKSAFGIGCS
ncbi:hypothetical protein BC835DRAFT_1524433 [Cytidiella melzeri]|nr:hypothetical protein BC835DRAFT_1524433 [Cytidiella melzeri]